MAKRVFVMAHVHTALPPPLNLPWILYKLLTCDAHSSHPTAIAARKRTRRPSSGWPSSEARARLGDDASVCSRSPEAPGSRVSEASDSSRPGSPQADAPAGSRPATPTPSLSALRRRGLTGRLSMSASRWSRSGDLTARSETRYTSRHSNSSSTSDSEDKAFLVPYHLAEAEKRRAEPSQLTRTMSARLFALSSDHDASQLATSTALSAIADAIDTQARASLALYTPSCHILALSTPLCHTPALSAHHIALSTAAPLRPRASRSSRKISQRASPRQPALQARRAAAREGASRGGPRT